MMQKFFQMITSEKSQTLEFYSNFDYEKIQSLFSNLVFTVYN
jgi:hypothetical protein